MARTRDRRLFYTTDQIGENRHLTPEGFLLIENVPIARIGVQEYGPDETPVKPGPDGLAHVHRDEEEVFSQNAMMSANGKPIVNEHPIQGPWADEGWDITPDNYQQLTCGTVLHPRRGTGDFADRLVADLLVKDRRAIRDIEAGKKEVSCGYTCDYEDMGGGHGRQKNIIINHVALVRNGRCGDRCAIGDEDTLMRTRDDGYGRSRDKLGRAIDKIRRAFRAKDELKHDEALDALEDVVGESTEGAVHGAAGEVRSPEKEDEHVHVHLGEEEPAGIEGEGGEQAPAWFTSYCEQNESRLDAIESTLQKLAGGETEDEAGEGGSSGAELPYRGGSSGPGTSTGEHDEAPNSENAPMKPNKKILGAMELEAPPGTALDARRARDSAFMQDSFQETVMLAEILAPGIRIPTFDRAARPTKTYDSICAFRRSALNIALNTVDGREIVENAHNGPVDVKSLDCVAVRNVFRAAAQVKRAQNNGGSTTHDAGRARALIGAGGGLGVTGKVKTLADLNRINAEYHDKRRT